MNSKRLSLGLLLLSASGAAAQTYLASSANAAYPALTNPTPLVLTGTAPLDNGRSSLPLGFSFPFYEKRYSELVVTANGLAMLEPSSCANCDYPGNAVFPSGVLPNGLLAPLWDDLEGSNAFSLLQWQSLSGPNGAGMAVEWSDWNNWWANSTYSLTFQLRLWENGLIEFFYGPLGGAGSALSAGVGIEDPSGTRGVAGKTCSNLQYGYCTLSEFAPNQSITFGPPAPPDLLVGSLKVDQIVAVGQDLELSTTLAIRNWGQAPAAGFSYRLFLSSNTTYEAGLDLPVTPAAVGPLTVSAMATLSHAAVSTAPRPATGSYYLLAVLDEGQLIAESDELNNVGATATPFVAGVDLVALGIGGPLSSGPGEQVTNHLTFSNRGIDAAGPVDYRIWLSTDTTLEPSDRLVQSGVIDVAGGQSIDQDVVYPLPTDIPSGDYWFVLQLDEGPLVGAIPEVSESNNVKFSPERFTSRQGDLAIGPVEVRDPLPPQALAQAAFFGEEIRLEAIVSNLGGATASGFSVAFYFSENATLNGVSDPEVGAVTGLSLAPGASMKVSLTQPVPAKSLSGVDLIPGDYWFFASAVPAGGFVEVSSTNNVSKSAPQAVRAPAPDLVASAVVGPPQAGLGELMAVSRSLRNLGNRSASSARYQYVLSANEIITEQDVILPLEGAGSGQGSVTLAVGAEDFATELVRIPAGIAAATYYLGVLVNPPGAGHLAEITYANNGLATGQVEVLPQALHFLTGTAPDALAGLPYTYQLSATGGSGSYTFALVQGQGELPEGLTLSAAGLLSGTATAPAVRSCVVSVQSAGQVVQMRLVLRVLPFTSQLVVTAGLLPPLARLAPYEFYFSAQGGQGPYRWELDSGSLAEGLALGGDGKLWGATSQAAGAQSQFTVRVIDSAGNLARGQYELQVLEAGDLVIQGPSIPAALVGSEYLVDLVARNAGGSALMGPVTWSVLSGRLPPGLALTPAGEVALLRGTPRTAGSYPISVVVRDGQGRADTAGFLLLVNPRTSGLRADLPSRVAPGEGLSATFTLTSGEAARFWLSGGRLPPGLSLSPEGGLGGQVELTSPLQAFNFTVSAAGVDGAVALGAFQLEVAEPEAASQASCGCTGPGPGLGPLAMAGLALQLLRRRRGAGARVQSSRGGA